MKRPLKLRVTTRTGAPVLAALAALLCGACRTPGLPTWAVPRCPGMLRPTGEIAGDFLLRQRVRVRREERDIPLELALEKRGDTLVVLGFDAFGAKLFSVTQRGLETEIDSLPPPALEVPPENVLSDLHRVHFLGLEPPPERRGQRSELRAGVRITETWEPGGASWREFDAPSEAPVRVELADGWALVRHPDCGYRATFVTLERRELP